jgi:hypothetical protein
MAQGGELHVPRRLEVSAGEHGPARCAGGVLPVRQDLERDPLGC